MSPELIQQKIEAQMPGAIVSMDGEDCNFSVTVISELFEGKSPLQRHRMVNDVFKTEFETGELHALSVKAQTP